MNPHHVTPKPEVVDESKLSRPRAVTATMWVLWICGAGILLFQFTYLQPAGLPLAWVRIAFAIICLITGIAIFLKTRTQTAVVAAILEMSLMVTETLRTAYLAYDNPRLYSGLIFGVYETIIGAVIVALLIAILAFRLYRNYDWFVITSFAEEGQTQASTQNSTHGDDLFADFKKR